MSRNDQLTTDSWVTAGRVTCERRLTTWLESQAGFHQNLSDNLENIIQKVQSIPCTYCGFDILFFRGF